jgi:hypothetical protein
VLPDEGLLPSDRPVGPAAGVPPLLPGIPGVLLPVLPDDPTLLADGTTLPPDPIDLGLIRGDLVVADAAADAAPVDLDPADDADPDLDPDHHLEDAPQDDDAPDPVREGPTSVLAPH